jgi:hypothetical protein
MPDVSKSLENFHNCWYFDTGIPIARELGTSLSTQPVELDPIGQMRP